MSNRFHLANFEQEVHINFDTEDKKARVYSSNKRWIEKMDKLVKEYPETYKCISEEYISNEMFLPKSECKKLINENPEMYYYSEEAGKYFERTLVSKSYELPKKLVTIRKPRTNIMTEEQKEAARERLANYRKKKVDE